MKDFSGSKVNRRLKLQLERLLEQSTSQKPIAVIFGGSVNGLSFARSLGRRKIPTLMLDNERLIGTYTRYGTVQILPNPEKYPEPWMEILEFVGSRGKSPGVIFTTSDFHELFVARNSNLLKQYFRFLIPEMYALESIVNKKSQYTVAEKAGIPIPKTFFPETTDEVNEISNRISYPCILKSYKSHLGRQVISKKVIIIRDSTELSENFSEVAMGEVKFMVQEIIPGDDSTLFGYLAFWDKNGEELYWLTKQKLRQCPPLYGDGSLQITVESPVVRELSKKLLKAFNYRGFVGIEYKFDARDSTYRLIEINPRTVSGNQLAISAGIDFPWIGYRYLTESCHGYNENSSFLLGTKYINEEWDFKAFLSLRKAGELSFPDWIRSIRGSRAKAIWAWDDPLPLLMIFWRSLKAVVRHIKRALTTLKIVLIAM